MQVPPDAVGKLFSLRARRGHFINESSNLGGELGMALGDQDVAGRAPTTFDFSAGLREP